MSAPAVLYSPDVESAIISLHLQHPEVFADFYLIKDTDFSPVYRPVWSAISQQLNQTPPAGVSPVLLCERLKSYGITKVGEAEPYDVLNGLLIRFVQKGEAAALARELKRVAVRRELIQQMESTKQELVKDVGASFERMTQVVEKGLTTVTTTYHRSDEFTNVFENLIEVTEARADAPLNVDEMGYMGPFPTMNKVLGGVAGIGQLISIGARTGNQKSALGFYYNLCIAERYKLPILLMDVGEMTLERIQRRAVCALAEGRVPLWAIASGEWRQNKEWKRIIHEECWPRIKPLQFHYINVGNMPPKDKITLIRRYAYNKIGRGNPFGILDDYLKGIEAIGKNTAEYQSIGYYVNDVKSLITGEIPAYYWTSVQNNRTGVYQGKKVADIVDSEDQMGVSDRIIQGSDWGFILRFKVAEELANEQVGGKPMFGNMRLTPVKTREALGREYEKALRPVRLPSGRYQPNFFNLDSRSFSFAEKGDLNGMLQTLGAGLVGMKDGQSHQSQAL